MKYLCVLLFIFKLHDSSGCCDYYAKGYDGNYENVWDSDCQEGPEDTYHPCDVDDLICIGDFLASNSQCSPCSGPIPNAISVPTMKFYVPVSNMTITNTDIIIRGFESAKIREFYLSIPTGNIVLAVTVQNLNLTAQKSFWSFQRPAKEPIVRADQFTFEEDYIYFTAVIPKIPSLTLEHAEIYSFIRNNTPKYYVGPKIYTTDDPTVNAAVAALRANILTAVKEWNVFYLYFLMQIFIQNKLCDFGVDPSNYLGFWPN